MRSLTMLVLLFVAHSALGADCTQGNPSGCVIEPAKTEINLAALPVDRYSYGILNNGTIPSCDANTSVRDCIRNILSNYKNQGPPGQGPTGVRFFFGLGGGGHSTPFAPDGGVYTCWLAMLNDFLADVHWAGYTHVTPTPVLVESWSAVEGSPYYADRTNVTSCGNPNPKTLRFFPWLPFGLDAANSYFPDCQGGDNNGYNTAVENIANWWGWNKYFRLLDFIFEKVKQNGLNMNIADFADFDMQNEVDFLNFTVLGRLIYDNKNQVDVVGTIRQKMVDNFGAAAGGWATFSTQMKRPKEPPPGEEFNCASFYGDSAMIILESERLAAFGNALVGTPAGLSQPNHLPCGGTQDGMIRLGVAYPSQPTVTNIHAHVCFAVGSGLNPDDCTTSDATNVAKVLYSEVWKYLGVREMTGNKVMFGEVNHTQGGPLQLCDGYYWNRAYDNVNGFIQSTLYTSSAASNTVLRVWQNIQNSCYTVPNTIKPPYGPP